MRILVDEHVGYLGRRKRIGHEGHRVLAPLDDIDALAAQLAHDHTDARALGTDAGADRIEVGLAGVHGDLGAGAGLARDGLDLDDTVVDLGDLELEQATDEVGMRAAHDDARTVAAVARARGTLGLLAGIAHVDDERLDTLVMLVVLVAGALVALVFVAAPVKVRQLGLDAIANLDDGEVGRGLEHGAGDELALAIGEFLVDARTGRVTDDLVDDALGVLGGDARHVVRRDVARLVVLVLAGLGILLADTDHLVDEDAATFTVDGDLCIPIEVEDALIAACEILLEALENGKLVDAALGGKIGECADEF